jgi:hypothetical protein
MNSDQSTEQISTKPNLSNLGDHDELTSDNVNKHGGSISDNVDKHGGSISDNVDKHGGSTNNNLDKHSGSTNDNLDKSISPADVITNNIIRYTNIHAMDGSAKWSTSEEKTIQKYIDKSRGYQYLYNKTFYYYQYYHLLLTIPLAVISTLSIGSQTIFSTISATNTSDQQSIYNIIGTILSVCVSFLTYLHMRFDFNGISTTCKSMASQFSNFADELEAILSFPREYRANPFQIITSIQTDYKKLTKLSENLIIPQKILEEYIAKHKDKVTLIDIV